MKALVVGSGGREHALCWKLRQSPLLRELYCAPGNPGIAQVADQVPIAADEIHQLADFAAELGIDLTVVGPELPLALGIVDEFQARGLTIFGPRQQAVELESSKVFAKQFMDRHGIPTAAWEVANDPDQTRRAARRFGFPVVLKVDGLAGGKGVMICENEEELEAHLRAIFKERRFGAAGERLVVEEYLEGEEVSFAAFCDGKRVLPIATSKDYKRLHDEDLGPNTGGMGTHSPAGVMNAAAAADIFDRIIRPTAAAMEEENRKLVGFLLAGLMITADGPRVMAYNVRPGDPELQALVLRMESDLLPILASCAHGGLETNRLHFRKATAVCLVLASAGYPHKPVRGEPLPDLDALELGEGVELFHAETMIKDGRLVSAGGRVLNVCATGPTLLDALKLAYATAAEIHWPSRIMRYDIGRRMVRRMTAGTPANPSPPRHPGGMD